METLLEALKGFQKKDGLNLPMLYEEFRTLAKVFLYGGYLLINNETKIYVHDIEFYYHEENGRISDPIVYHQNKNGKQIDYFPLGYLHQHISGIDITFEKKDVYRASALIRAFDVVNRENIVLVKNDKRSTFIYDYLSLVNDVFSTSTLSVKWVDQPVYIEDNLTGIPRQNVPAFDGEEKIKAKKGERAIGKYKLDIDRLWRFNRNTDIEKLI